MYCVGVLIEEFEPGIPKLSVSMRASMAMKAMRFCIKNNLIMYLSSALLFIFYFSWKC